jgi:predicted nucleic acid-binding protein
MKPALDTSVIVAALDGSDPDHPACRKLLLSEKFAAFSHALTETFSTLTGGRLGIRISSSVAASILREKVAPRLAIISLTESELLACYENAEARGVRGGAVYDYLHLAAAKSAGAPRIYTLNVTDFRAIHRPGDPQIVHP